MAGLLWYRSYMDSLANTSGYYPDIHAGHADRVTELTLEEPYLVRETPAGYNQLELMELVGGTVAWNQLCNSSSVTGTSGHKFYLKKGGAESITNTDTFTGLSNGTDMVIDITLMLGSTLANYVYSLEQATAGSGIQWLKDYDLIDDEYHAYTTPTLQSVEATAHVTKDANDTVIATYPLDSDLVLRGIPKLEDGLLTYDGDTYEPDGTVTRKYAEVIYDGSSDENWAIAANYNGSNYQHTFFRIQNVPNMKTYSASTADYVKNMKADWAEPLYVPDGTIDNHWTMRRASGSPTFYVLSPTSDGAVSLDTFKAKLAATPLHVVYELATQTTESADPFTAVQTVEDGGTEEFVTTNGVPVGNVSVYRRA